MQRDLDHDLTQAELEQLMHHLDHCPDCSLMYERLNRLSTELANLPKIDPPISIVDSILPKLERLEPEQGELEASSHEPKVRWMHKLKDSISIRALGGVVAAAVLLTIIVNGMLPGKEEVSDDALDLGMFNRASSNSALESSSANDSADESSGLMKRKEEPLQHELFSMSSPETDAPESGEPDRAKPEESQQSGGAPKQQAEQMDEGSNAAPSADPEPAMDQVPADRSVANNTGDGEESFPTEQAPSIAAPDEGAFGITAMPEEPVVYVSPDGNYIASIVEEEQGIYVHITDGEQTPVMDSSKFAADHLSVEWKSDTVLTVTVNKDGAATEYELDAKLKQEKLADLP